MKAGEAIALACRAAQYAANGTAHTFAYFSMFGSIDLFVGGMIVAEIWLHLDERNVRLSLWWSLVGIVAVWAIIRGLFSVPTFFQVDYNHVTLDGISRSSGWALWPLIQAMMWGAVLLVYLRARTAIPCSAWLASFGRWSYSTYIWHILVITLVKNKLLWMSPYALGIFVVLPLTLFVSFASYHLLEVPFLGLRAAYAKPQMVPEAKVAA